MGKPNRQKAKLLLLMEMLSRDSDEEHPLTTRELLNRLEKKEISCDRRTLSIDMADLNALGYQVCSMMIGHEKGYFMAKSQWSVPELRVLMDAVQAAEFIPPEQSDAMSEKLSALGGSHKAELLLNSTVMFNARKHTNAEIMDTVGVLDSAIVSGSQVSFCYFDLNEERERVYRKDGARYTVEPVGLVMARERYYLTAISPDREGVSSYRVDRMHDAREENMPISHQAAKARKHLPELTQQTFKMFAGNTEVVTLEFEEQLIGCVFDQFGEDARITRKEDGTCRARVKVQISPTFFGWLFQFGSGMKLTQPQRVVQQVRNFLDCLPYND